MATLPSFESCYGTINTDTIHDLGIAANQQWQRYDAARDRMRAKLDTLEERWLFPYPAAEQFGAFAKQFDDVVSVGNGPARFWRSVEFVNACREYLGNANYLVLTAEERKKQPEAERKIEALRKECLEPKAVEMWVAAERLEGLVEKMTKEWELLITLHPQWASGS